LKELLRMEIRDQYSRTFKTLRLSLTSNCNLGCVYCVNSTDKENTLVNKNIAMSYQEIVYAVKKIHELTGLETVRLTGGEPTLYKDLIPIIKEIRSIGIENIKMTSNGYLLKEMIPSLVEAGLNKINISLDAISRDGFNKISGRKNLEKILEAIDKGLEYGIEIKINAVILKNVNDDQIVPLFDFSKERNITLRFLELMQMGPLHKAKEFEKYFVSEKEILNNLAAHTTFTPILRRPSDTANYWISEEGYKFGIIANESSPFCGDCNRLRLDSFGNIYGCLSNDAALSIRYELNDENKLREKLMEALSYKQELKFTGSAISMMAIGG
jgi:cyclic pyranopterin phosphate synthase